ncbi:MAG: sodium-dependent transporter, partial [Elusimicrobiota bacterium]
ILVFAGVSSGISIIEAFTSSVMDKFHYSRSIVVSVSCILGFFFSIIFTTGAGLYWLDIADHFITSYGLVIVGLLECLVIGWYLKAEKMREHINKVSSVKLGKWWEYSIKIITPAILVIILISSIFQEFSAPYEGYPVKWLILIGRDWLLFTLIAAIIITSYEWRKKAED